jgi:hypothetical protein
MGIISMACIPWARQRAVSSLLRTLLKKRAKVIFINIHSIWKKQRLQERRPRVLPELLSRVPCGYQAKLLDEIQGTLTAKDGPEKLPIPIYIFEPPS